MPQNRETGATAREYGLKTAALIAEHIGAKRLTANANEFQWNGQRITIRMAHQGNGNVGVRYLMLERVKIVIGAFEIAPNEYDLLSLPAHVYQEYLRDSPSNKGKVGLVHKKVFSEKGTSVGRVKLNY